MKATIHTALGRIELDGSVNEIREVIQDAPRGAPVVPEPVPPAPRAKRAHMASEKIAALIHKATSMTIARTNEQIAKATRLAPPTTYRWLQRAVAAGTYKRDAQKCYTRVE